MLKFYIGASGYGKTTKIIDDIIERSVNEPDRQFTIIVPDQFTMQTQKEVVLSHPRKGINPASLISRRSNAPKASFSFDILSPPPKKYVCLHTNILTAVTQAKHEKRAPKLALFFHSVLL